MADPASRLKAVVSALEKIREHVQKFDDLDDVSTNGYNRWVGMLEGAVTGDFSRLKLPDDEIPAREYLMHLDAAIAFLPGHA